MGGDLLLSGDRTVTFAVQDPKDGRTVLKLTARGRDVVLEQMSGAREGQSAVIADCLHMLGPNAG